MLITCERAHTGETILAAWTPCNALTNHGVKRYMPGVGMMRRMGTGTPIPMSVDLLSPFDPVRQQAIAHEVRAELEAGYAAIFTRHPWASRAAYRPHDGQVTIPAWQEVPAAAFYSTTPTHEIPVPTRIVLTHDGAVVADEVFIAVRTADQFRLWFHREYGAGGGLLQRADKAMPFVGMPRVLATGARRAFGAWCRSQHATVTRFPVAQSA